MNELLRKTIVMAPMAACVLMLAWYWLGGVDHPQQEPATAGTASSSSTETHAAPVHASKQQDDAQSFSSWLSYQGEIDAQASGTVDAAAPATPVPMDIPMPEPLYMLDSQVPIEQRIADASQHAIRGESPQVRAAALGELAVIGDASVLSILNEALVDADPQVRLAAITAARRLAQYHGDESGEIRRWLIEAGNAADTLMAMKAREDANDLAQNYGEDAPFP